LIKTLSIAAIVLAITAPSFAQPCPDVRSASDRHAGALRLAKCLADPDPKVRDALAFEGLSSLMRSGGFEQRTLSELKFALLEQLRRPDSSAILRSFSALTLSEVARTDRIKAWMTEAERQELVDAAAGFLAGIADYRAFSSQEGFVHAVAHGADFALQLALNPAIAKPQLDTLLTALSTQIAPGDPGVAYWAGEPDRLARAVVFIAQRKLHTEAEWNAWFQAVMNPKPLASWDVAFTSETGIRKHHNVRAFLLSVFATAVTSEDAGIKQLTGPVRESLKQVP
jgi:hypothetical protein